MVVGEDDDVVAMLCIRQAAEDRVQMTTHVMRRVNAVRDSA
jgi:hypothetical protein